MTLLHDAMGFVCSMKLLTHLRVVVDSLYFGAPMVSMEAEEGSDKITHTLLVKVLCIRDKYLQVNFNLRRIKD